MLKWWRSQIRPEFSVLAVTFNLLAAVVLLVAIVLLLSKHVTLETFLKVTGIIVCVWLPMETWQTWRQGVQKK